MSYTIFYRSMFVKTRDNKYIPIIEGGDNNCYEAGSMRRARSWHSIYSIAEETKALLTAKEIMDGVERRWVKMMKEQYVGKPIDLYGESPRPVTEQDVEDNFGDYFGLAIGNANSNTSAQTVRNFFKRAVKNAVNFGEIDLKVCWYAKDKDVDVHIERCRVETEEELETMYLGLRSTGYDPWIDFVDPYAPEIIFQRRKDERVNRKRNEYEKRIARQGASKNNTSKKQLKTIRLCK